MIGGGGEGHPMCAFFLEELTLYNFIFQINISNYFVYYLKLRRIFKFQIKLKFNFEFEIKHVCIGNILAIFFFKCPKILSKRKYLYDWFLLLMHDLSMHPVNF